ncbi:MAG: hypothetical protein LBT46_11620 [Planctomycetaceae bacterium]|nr:hypothetical protein [Planctomycetaceae bacterium]
MQSARDINRRRLIKSVNKGQYGVIVPLFRHLSTAALASVRNKEKPPENYGEKNVSPHSFR